MTLFKTTILAALFVASTSAANAGPTPDTVRDGLRRDGPEATVGRLAANGTWDNVLDHIAQGERPWIALAPAPARGADAGAAEALTIALAKALPRNPRAVIHVLDPNDGPVLGSSRVCAMPFIEPTPAFARRYRHQAVAAIAAAKDPSDRAERGACLAALRRS